VQSNGALRATDFDAMLLRHPQELGLAIDHWAALVLEGEAYRVISVGGKAGSVAADGGFRAPDPAAPAADDGRPGVWRKEVVGGAVRRTAAAAARHPRGDRATLRRRGWRRPRHRPRTGVTCAAPRGRW
jgi:dipeptidase E